MAPPVAQFGESTCLIYKRLLVQIQSGGRERKGDKVAMKDRGDSLIISKELSEEARGWVTRVSFGHIRTPISKEKLDFIIGALDLDVEAGKAYGRKGPPGLNELFIESLYDAPEPTQTIDVFFDKLATEDLEKEPS